MKNVPEVSDDLDPTFGSGGIVRFPLQDVMENVPTAVCGRPDDSLFVAIRAPALVGAPSALAKLDQIGRLDTTYADRGIKKFDFADGFFDPQEIINLSGGGCAVVGKAVRGFNDEFAVYKLIASGQSDPSFGQAGKIVILPQDLIDPIADAAAVSACRESAKAKVGSTTALGAVVNDAGKMYVAGTMFLRGAYRGFIVCLEEDGTPSSSFNGGGCVIVDPYSPYLQCYAHDVAVLPDGRVLACGFCYGASGRGNAGYIACYDKTGRKDLSFGVNGMVVVEETGIDVLESLTASAQGKIFASGTANGAGLILALKESGTFDDEFNGGQPLIASLPGLLANITWLRCHLHDDGGGKIVVAGVADGDGGAVSLVTARYLSDAEIDLTYAGRGWNAVDDSRGRDVYAGSTLMTDKRVVLGGTLLMGQPVESYLRRYSA